MYAIPVVCGDLGRSNSRARHALRFGSLALLGFPFRPPTLQQVANGLLTEEDIRIK